MDDLTSLFAEHHAGLVRLAALITGDTQVAEDVVAEVFVKLVRRPPAADNPLAYLRRSVINEAKGSWRRRLRDRDRIAKVERLGPPVERIDDPADVRAEHDRIWRALTDLPPRQRTAVVLRYYEDLSERDTAAAMGVSLGTVKSTTARGLAALKARLADERTEVEGRAGQLCAA